MLFEKLRNATIEVTAPLEVVGPFAAVSTSCRCGGSMSGGGGDLTDAFDHRMQAVGAGRAEMLAEADLVEHRRRIGENFLRFAIGIEAKEQRD